MSDVDVKGMPEGTMASRKECLTRIVECLKGRSRAKVMVVVPNNSVAPAVHATLANVKFDVPVRSRDACDVVTFSSLESRAARGPIKFRDYDLIVVDELHKGQYGRLADVMDGCPAWMRVHLPTPCKGWGKHLLAE